MQPFGSQVRPEIGIDFEINGKAYALRKAFCHNPEAELTGPGETASGDAVEERLQALLGFEPPGKGAAKPEHRGTWGLFWVEQGTAFARPQLGPTGRETLVSALESEVGQVLGGERGRALIAAIAERNDAFFTRTGRPRGAHKDSLDRVPELEGELAGLRDRLAEYDRKTDALGRMRARLLGYTNERSLETAVEALRNASAAQTALDALKGALDVAGTEEKLALADLTAARTSWRNRDDRIGEIARNLTAENACRERAAAAQAALAAIREHREALQRRVDAASDDFNRAEAVIAACDRALQRARAMRERDELQGHFSKASGGKTQLDALRAEAAKIRVTAEKVAELRGLERDAAMASLRLQSLATRLGFAPDGRRTVTIDGKAIAPDQPLLLTEEAHLILEGFGGLTVTPGGEDLVPLRTAAARTDEQLSSGLRRLGVADVAEAERLLSRRAELLAEAGTHEATVNAHAPGGLAALAQRLALKEAELADLSEGASPDAPGVDEAESHRNAAGRKRDQAKAALDQAEAALKEADGAHSASKEAHLTERNNLEHAERQRKTGEAVLAEERARSGDADLQAALQTKADQHQRADEKLAACRAAIEKANPEAVGLRLEMSKQALERIRTDIDKTTGQARELEGELRGLGQAGLGEQLAEKEGELQRARAHAARIEREAGATRLLLETLNAAERQAKETFLAPVRERIKPYLRLLFPDTEVVLGEDDLAISHLRRGGVDEPFESLSVGTREQLAVLTRLAFAEFLRDKGRPAAVILDDALAYSDDARFDRMQVVLRKAAEKLQVIVLTCRERDYHSLGAPILRLADCN